MRLCLHTVQGVAPLPKQPQHAAGAAGMWGLVVAECLACHRTGPGEECGAVQTGVSCKETWPSVVAGTQIAGVYLRMYAHVCRMAGSITLLCWSVHCQTDKRAIKL